MNHPPDPLALVPPESFKKARFRAVLPVPVIVSAVRSIAQLVGRVRNDFNPFILCIYRVKALYKNKGR